MIATIEASIGIKIPEPKPVVDLTSTPILDSEVQKVHPDIVPKLESCDYDEYHMIPKFSAVRRDELTPTEAQKATMVVQAYRNLLYSLPLNLTDEDNQRLSGIVDRYEDFFYRVVYGAVKLPKLD